jgi:hypothetical protein
MMRVGGVAAFCAFVWLVPSALPAVAMSSGTVPTRLVAVRLAAIIERDARQAVRSHAIVTVVRRCCGTRALRIHYRVKPTGSIVAGTYVLRLETSRDAVQGVGVFESANELDPRLGAHGENGWRFVFVIHHERRGSHGGWAFGASFEEGESGGGSNGASFGVSSLRECRLPRPVPIALYHEVVGVLMGAPRHELVRPDPATAC